MARGVWELLPTLIHPAPITHDHPCLLLREEPGYTMLLQREAVAAEGMAA